MKQIIYTVLFFLLLVSSGAVFSEPNKPSDYPDFPSFPPVKDADPEIRREQIFEIPTRLIVKRTSEKIDVSVDMDSFKTVRIEVGHKMIVGFKHDIFVISEGTKKHVASGLGGTAYVGTAHITPQLDGIPKSGEKYIIEVVFIIFETDIPIQHHWMPRSGKYRELRTERVKSEQL